MGGCRAGFTPPRRLTHTNWRYILAVSLKGASWPPPHNTSPHTLDAQARDAARELSVNFAGETLARQQNGLKIIITPFQLGPIGIRVIAIRLPTL